MERSIVTRHQMHVMVSYIEKNPKMISGKVSDNFTSLDKKKLWGELSKRLNAEGPCQKSLDKWIRSWVDLKSNVKRKAAEIRRGLPHNSTKTLNPLEKRVIAMIRLADARRQMKDAPNDDEYRQQISIFKKAEDQLKKSFSKFSFSGALLPSMTKSQLKELIEIDSEQKPLVDDACMSEPTSSKEPPSSISETCTSECVYPENQSVSVVENSSLSLFGEPAETKELTIPENTLEEPIIVKQEPPDDIPYEANSVSEQTSALEPQNPIIVSVAPVLAAKEPLYPIEQLNVPEAIELQSFMNGSPSTKDLQPDRLINTVDDTNREFLVSDSGDHIAPSEKHQLEDCNHNTDPNLLLNEGRRNNFKANKTKQSIAIKAAGALTSMAERNCIVLERIATAIEIQAVQSVKIATAIEVQAAQSVKQTQLIDQLINILSKK